MLDPVSMVAGVIRAELPTVDMQTCAKLAWDIVNALQGAAAVTQPGKVPGP